MDTEDVKKIKDAIKDAKERLEPARPYLAPVANTVINMLLELTEAMMEEIALLESELKSLKGED